MSKFSSALGFSFIIDINVSKVYFGSWQELGVRF